MRLPLTTMAIALFALGCPQPKVEDAGGAITFQKERVDLGQAWEGDALSGEAILHNRGRSPLALDWTLPRELQGFAFPELPATAPAGETVLPLGFTAGPAGPFEVTLTVRAGPKNEATLVVAARSRAIPDCATPVVCHQAHFDKALERCVETPVADDTPCDTQSLCLTDATCQAGLCTGTPVVCDDGNACTLDTCNALTGCEFPPAPPCPGDGKCQVGVCDPTEGCGLAPAPDGTVCGSMTCEAAEICLGGTCVMEDPPDGFVCKEASPCQGQGTCNGSLCEAPPATPLLPTWSFSSAAQPGAPALHDFVLEDDGQASLMGFFSMPLLRANGAQAIQLEDVARRCIVWNGQLACADFRGDYPTDGQVSLLDLDTGEALWNFRLAEARPDFRENTQNLFMARIASMGTDRLAAIFEAYPEGGSSGTLCRYYFLVVLDAGGGLVAAKKLEDPLLDQCNHPHPYGLAADSAGNLYLSFSSSSPGNAPLAPQAPTLLISFTRDGNERWRRTEHILGGEVGVAGPYLFPEGATAPHLTADGSPVPVSMIEPGRGPMGRVVASSSRYVHSPRMANGGTFPNNVLAAYQTADAQSAWRYTLPEGDFFLSRETRAVTWKPRDQARARTAVLAFAQRGGLRHLTAVDFEDGQELWTCEVAAPMQTFPQLFEIAGQTLTVMGDATTCGDCDPPFALSRASFWTFEVPGLLPAPLSWTGTFGGPGHDHREDGLGALIGGASTRAASAR